ncbi:phosphotransferase [Bacillus changyiensis]|uniref:phosphotransferase n=1 Tax=Bacillus changyiensis TaxID=3004103 RepID=UPI0022DFB329|nr:phosphotransferase [Bacillus changyiensis]MDA1475867.1 phosphotransferase [Bacillus changyiensis]
MTDEATLQKLFQQKIKKAVVLGDLYEGRANNVWRIIFEDVPDCIVREPKSGIEESEFSFGCKEIFGLNMSHVYEHIEIVNEQLKNTNSFAIPAVIRKQQVEGRRFLVMEKIEGQQVASFIDRSPEFLMDYGRQLANLHQFHAAYFGTVHEGKRADLSVFHQTLVSTAEKLIDRYDMYSKHIREYFPIFKEKIRNLKSPVSASFILIDIDPSQYVEKNGMISGLVDTEAVAIGPREYDFVALEYLLTEREALFIQQGYEDISNLPKNLAAVRECYRFICLLLDIHGTWDFHQWMRHPVRFF